MRVITLLRMCTLTLLASVTVVPDRLAAEGLTDSVDRISLWQCKRVSNEWRPAAVILSLLTPEKLQALRSNAANAAMIDDCVAHMRKMICASAYVDLVLDIVKSSTGTVDGELSPCAVVGAVAGYRKEGDRFEKAKRYALATGLCTAAIEGYKALDCRRRSEKISTLANQVNVPVRIESPGKFVVSFIRQVTNSSLSPQEKLMIQAEIAARTRTIMSVENTQDNE